VSLVLEKQHIRVIRYGVSKKFTIIRNNGPNNDYLWKNTTRHEDMTVFDTKENDRIICCQDFELTLCPIIDRNKNAFCYVCNKVYFNAQIEIID